MIELKKAYLDAMVDNLSTAQVEAMLDESVDRSASKKYEDMYNRFFELAEILSGDDFSSKMMDKLTEYGRDFENKLSKHEESPTDIVVKDHEKLAQNENPDVTIIVQLKQIADALKPQRDNMDKWQHFIEKNSPSKEKEAIVNHIQSAYKKELALHQKFINSYNAWRTKNLQLAKNFLTNPKADNKDKILQFIESAKKLDRLVDNTEELKQDLIKLTKLKGILLGLRSHISTPSQEPAVQLFLDYVDAVLPKVHEAYEIMAYCYHPQYIKTAKEYHELAIDSLQYLAPKIENLEKKYLDARPHSLSIDIHTQERALLIRSLFSENQTGKDIKINKRVGEEEDESEGENKKEHHAKK